MIKFQFQKVTHVLSCDSFLDLGITVSTVFPSINRISWQYSLSLLALIVWYFIMWKVFRTAFDRGKDAQDLNINYCCICKREPTRPGVPSCHSCYFTTRIVSMHVPSLTDQVWLLTNSSVVEILSQNCPTCDVDFVQQRNTFHLYK